VYSGYTTDREACHLQTQQATTNTSSAALLHQLDRAFELVARGDLFEARRIQARAIVQARRHRFDWLPAALGDLGDTLRLLGRHQATIALLREAAALFHQQGDTKQVRCHLLELCEVYLDKDNAEGAKETLQRLGGGQDTNTVRGRLYALTGNRYKLHDVAQQIRRGDGPLTADDWLVLALNDQADGFTKRAAERLEVGLRLAAESWDTHAMERIKRAQEALQRGGESA
jgi:tetratricopeptide (TPR) repeat protein